MLPESSLLTAERKAELDEVFCRRRNGLIDGTIKVRLVEDIHETAVMLDPNLCTDFKPFEQAFENHASLYAKDQNIDADTVSYFVEKLLTDYIDVYHGWKNKKGSMHSQDREQILSYEGKPIMWWKTQYKGSDHLKQFAISTLSCSPTGSFVESSFSMQKQIQTPQRNKLSSTKVAKLMFCRWNLQMSRGLHRLDKEEFFNSLFNTEKLVRSYVRDKNMQTEGTGAGSDSDLHLDANVDDQEISSDEGDYEFFTDDADSDDNI